MRKLFLSKFFLFVLMSVNAQAELEDYLVNSKGDTIYCNVISVYRASAQVFKIEYINSDGSLVSLNRKECIDVMTIGVGGYTVDYIPLKAHKPDSYKRHIRRKIDGAIKVYDEIQLYVRMEGETRKIYSIELNAKPVYCVQLDNGAYYKLTDKNIVKYISPYLNKNEQFKSGYKKPLNMATIEEAIRYYNDNCVSE